MRFFGINHGRHDSGIACFSEDGQLLHFSQSERLTRGKNERDAGMLAKQLEAAGLEPVQRDDLFFNTWPRFYPKFFRSQIWPLEFSEREKSSLPGFEPQCQVHQLNHHHCHAAAAWMFRPEENLKESLYLVLDGVGIRQNGAEGFYSVGVISPTTFKEHSYKLDKLKFSPYCRLNRIALPHTDSLQVAGKLMGLAGFVPRNHIRRFIEPPQVGALNSAIEKRGLTPWLMAQCASLYFSYIEDVKEHLATVVALYPHRNVVVSGGVFLALELNSWLAESGRRVIFPPCVNDSGIALGSAAYGYFLTKGRWPQRLTTPYLQWHPPEQRNKYISPSEAAALLAQGEIIGLVTGKGEVGPRALGNRSLLAVPTKKNSRRVSEEIKGREFYRPVAPIVTDREFSRLFYGAAGHYMQYRNLCAAEIHELAPGIVHNDNTARVQVLRHDGHPWLYELLTEVGKLTGVECLINTSLNGKGRPICNTLADAMEEFADKKVRIISF